MCEKSLDKQLGICSRKYAITFCQGLRGCLWKREVGIWEKKSKLGGKDGLRN